METVIDKIKVEKYSSYKNSGAEWLGDIPTHWNTLSNKNIFTLKKNQVGKKSSDYVLLSLTLNGVIKRDMENPQGKFPAEFNTYQEVKKGDFIFCLFDVEETPRCVGLSDFDGMITGAYTVMEPNDNFDRNFLYYFYLNLDADKRLKPLYTGLRNTISKENFFSFKSFVPPKEEQTAIAAFLDRKTALIDQAIDIKQKQIELLKERRQILIHKAVTRGLNPNVKMKDSGVEWIGQIPIHWHLKTLKFLKANIKNAFVDGPFGSNLKSEHFIEDGNVYVVESGFITTGVFINKVFKTISEKHYQTIKRSTCNEGDVIIAKIGANYGMAAELPLLDKKAVVSGNSLKITLDNSKILNILFVKLLGLSKTLGGFEDIVNASAQPALSLGGLNNLKLPIPPIDEQPLIAKHIDNIESKIATAISLKEQEIEKLKEYKATLINSAVTGKIKVC